MFTQYEDTTVVGRALGDFIKSRMPHLSSAVATKAGGRAAQRILGVLEEEVAAALASDTSTASRTTTTLMSLPRELRDQIWELVVVKDGKERITNGIKRERALLISGSKTTVRLPGLCLVSKQVRDEALDIFLGKHTFILKSTRSGGHTAVAKGTTSFETDA